jgi:hypothetical protein
MANVKEFSNIHWDSGKATQEQRKPYSRPELVHLGDLRSLTFGPSVGIGDSQCTSTGCYDRSFFGQSVKIKPDPSILGTPPANFPPGWGNPTSQP